MRKTNKIITNDFESLLTKLYGKIGTKRRIENDIRLCQIEKAQIEMAKSI
jgi:hypothetical protein